MITCEGSPRSEARNPRGRPPRLRVSSSEIVELYRRQQQSFAASHAKILANRRQYTTRETELDRSFAKVISLLEEIGYRVERLHEALAGDEVALTEIYRSVLGDRLDQKSAPYLFDVISFVLRLRTSTREAVTQSDAISRSASYLALQARKLADAVKVSNVDKRFVAALEEYYSMAIRNFDPILIDLLSNRLRAFPDRTERGAVRARNCGDDCPAPFTTSTATIP